jgi:histidinol-phosphate aminotransferase
MTALSSTLVHGGPDDGLPIRVDFSTNAHPLGPNPTVRAAVDRADRTRYPDPHYTTLRSALGAFHYVDADRIVVGASASELIWRLTRCWNTTVGAAVLTDDRTYGEYLRAARALNVPACADRSLWPADTAVLQWWCNPDNPSGANQDEAIAKMLDGSKVTYRDLIVVDLAYWPFRTLLIDAPLSPPLLTTPWADRVVQLWSPNKLHGLTGVRGAYLVLPRNSHALISADTLTSIAPSWVLGGDGVALLEAHVSPESSDFLRNTAPTLRRWKQAQDTRLKQAGWQEQLSPLHYGLWQPPIPPSRHAEWHARLREEGIKVRDATSFGRPGWVRLVSRARPDVEQLLTLTEPFQDHT